MSNPITWKLGPHRRRRRAGGLALLPAEGNHQPRSRSPGRLRTWSFRSKPAAAVKSEIDLAINRIGQMLKRKGDSPTPASAARPTVWAWTSREPTRRARPRYGRSSTRSFPAGTSRLPAPTGPSAFPTRSGNRSRRRLSTRRSPCCRQRVDELGVKGADHPEAGELGRSHRRRASRPRRSRARQGRLAGSGGARMEGRRRTRRA